jgi:putative tryptophan/tyrosine transport system substrate-binding protein
VNRRSFITILGGAAAWPLAARAQQGERLRRIGVLLPFAEGDAESQVRIRVLEQALQQSGWTLGRNLRIDIGWGHDEESRQRLAAHLVSLQPDLIFSQSTPSTAALVQQTRNIPIVFVQVFDPVGSGFLASIPRPGGNVTGFITMEQAMAGKWLELLKEIAPRVNRVAILFNPATATYAEMYLSSFKDAAVALGVEAIVAPIRGTSEIEPVIAAQAREPNSGLIVMPDAFMVAQRAAVASLAARHRLPAISAYRFYTEHGALLSYGNDVTDSFRRAAVYVDRILRGEKPADLPVQAPVKFDLVINLATAKSMGLEIPPMLLARADEVIE